MIGFANSKINLGLNILARRKDGYHDISTCFYPVGWNDILEIVPISTGKTYLKATGLGIPPSKEENLCLRAFRLLKKDFDIPEVGIYLHKQIPSGSGLGGGSSDASCVLKLVNTMFNLFLDNEMLAWYALKLGSDCPFFIYNKPLIASGRGEVFEDINIDLSGLFIIIVNPGFAISTAEAYRILKPAVPEMNLKEILEQKKIDDWKEILLNDFESFALKEFPVLTEIKNSLYNAGAAYVSMTGSGSGIYALFRKPPENPPSFPKEYLTWSGIL
jgi:4-diphosphocytidyl-2-C-methyl-D-erythritol kinase